MRGLAALGFAGANVTAPHKLAAARLWPRRTLRSVNTLVFATAGCAATSTDAAILAGLAARAAGRIGGGGAAPRVRARRCRGARLLAARRLAAGGRATPTWSSTPRRSATRCSSARARPDARRPAVPATTATARGRPGGRRDACVDGLEVLVAQGAASFELWTGLPAPVEVMRARSRLAPVTLELVTAGESHGPALVAIVTGLPAGLVLDRDGDRRRPAPPPAGLRPQPAPADRAATTVEVLAGLRHGRTLGTPLALVVRNRDHENWTWGMSPWPPEGEPHGKGTKPVTLPRPGHADLAGVLKYGLDDVRDALERASARHTAALVAAGAVAKALLRRARHRASTGEVVGDDRRAASVDDAARADRDTRRRRRRGARERRPARASARTRPKDARLDARLAAALMGIQAVKGVEIGDGLRARAPARLRGARRDRATGLHRATNRAGGIEAGVSNGEEIVVRAAMKPLPTLMRPLRSVDLETGEPAEALVERSDVAAVEALAVVAEAAVAWELARAAREKFGGDAIGGLRSPRYRAYLERIDWRRTR